MFDRSEINYLRSRVIELERQLAEERAENRRTERWCLNMLMRRARSIPVPPLAPTEEHIPEPRHVTESDIGTYEAIRAEAERLGKSTKDEEVRTWIREATGWTEEDIEKAIRSN